MRVFIYKKMESYGIQLTLYVAKNDNKAVEKDDDCTIGEDSTMTIYETDKILSLFPGKTVDDFNYGLTEIKKLSQELLKSLGRRKIFLEFINSFETTLNSFPGKTISDIESLRITFDQGDLCGDIKWADGEIDYII